MLTREGARLQIFLEIRRRYGLMRGPDEILILDELTIERPWGWVFQIRRRGVPGGGYAAVTHGGGYSSFWINRHDGVIIVGKHKPTWQDIQIFEANLDRASASE